MRLSGSMVPARPSAFGADSYGSRSATTISLATAGGRRLHPAQRRGRTGRAFRVGGRHPVASRRPYGHGSSAWPPPWNPLRPRVAQRGSLGGQVEGPAEAEGPERVRHSVRGGRGVRSWSAGGEFGSVFAVAACCPSRVIWASIFRRCIGADQFSSKRADSFFAVGARSASGLRADRLCLPAGRAAGRRAAGRDGWSGAWRSWRAGPCRRWWAAPCSRGEWRRVGRFFGGIGAGSADRNLPCFARSGSSSLWGDLKVMVLRTAIWMQ